MRIGLLLCVAITVGGLLERGYANLDHRVFWPSLIVACGALGWTGSWLEHRLTRRSR